MIGTKKLFGLLVTTLSLLSTLQLCSHQASAQGTHPDNGVWLSHAYVTTQSYVDSVPALAYDMKQNYKVLYWFVNVGTVNSSGQIINGASGLSKAVAFLNAVKGWEGSNSYQFKVFAWISGSLTTTNPNYIDVSNATKRTAVVNECKKFISTSVAGSYVAGATRAFDGVQIDFEPSGFDSTRFDNLKLLMDELRSAFTAYPGKLTSYAAHKYGTANEWWWSPTFYYYMARRVDILAAMTYDSALTTGTDYQNWMRDQTTGILRAVSGKYWTDGSHPAPTNSVKVIIGFPAFPASTQHIIAAENIKYAAPGVDAGLASLTASGDPSGAYFQGAGVYLHTDGTGSDGYASKTTDWWWFGHYWLGAW